MIFTESLSSIKCASDAEALRTLQFKELYDIIFDLTLLISFPLP